MSVDVEPPIVRERRLARRDRVRSAIAVVLATAMLVGVGVGLYSFGRNLLPSSDPPVEDFVGAGTGSVIIVVERGDTASLVGRTLERAKVVKSQRAFIRVARARAEDSERIAPGTYDMRLQMSADAALDRLLDAKARLVNKVTLPEGLRLTQTIATLAKATGIPARTYLAALRNPAALGLPSYARGRVEGFLFPATYELQPGTPPAAVLKTIIARFDQSADRVRLTGRELSPYELVTVASLVEAEASRAGDYGKVARVVYNRLEEGMPMQFDSTINYALRANKAIVTDKDLEVDSPYNTYRNRGLPPGPIGSPGEAALKAAANPTPGDWLYFVTTNLKTGETKFTSSYSEFLRFKAELKRNR